MKRGGTGFTRVAAIRASIAWEGQNNDISIHSNGQKCVNALKIILGLCRNIAYNQELVDFNTGTDSSDQFMYQ